MNNTYSFSSLVQDDLSLVETRLHQSVGADFPALSSALDLIFSAGGKRIRPNMILLLGAMIQAPKDRLLTLATAIEMLHTATLVHDDLIDQAILRRGNPTLNSQWSPGATVLTGDLIFACSARMAADIECIPAMKLFSQALIEIVNGELNQMFENRFQNSREGYFKRIYAKTASMFQTGARCTALITTDDDKIEKALGNFGHDIGIAFQIIDDILDFTGEQATVGKPVANDLRQGLITLPAIFFLEDHPDHIEAKNMKAGKFLDSEERVINLVSDIRNSDAIQKAHKQACNYIQSGLAELDIFPDSPEHQALEDLSNYIVKRDL